jgi:hypothetical protein
MAQIRYATSQGLLVNHYTNSEANPVQADYNLYYSPLSSSSASFVWNGTSLNGFLTYQANSANDGHSRYADPQFLSLTTPDFNVQATSPAIDAGNNLGPTVVCTLDFGGNARVQGAGIDIGAYEQ